MKILSKNGVIEKVVGELKLQNMIFKAHKNKAKSKGDLGSIFCK